MGFYSKIVPNNDIDHSARRENDISEVLNNLGGAGVPSIKSKGASYNRIIACNFGASNLAIGMAVKFTGKADESGTIFDVEKATDSTSPYGILLSDLPPSGAAGVLVSGATLIEVEIKSNSHEYATPSPSGMLESASTGQCRILWREGAVGKKKCLILLGFGGAGGGYTGMFKIVQTEAGDDKKKPKIKIVDGSNPGAETCGVVLINNKRFNISAKEFEVTSAGFIVLTSEYDSSGKTPKAPEMKFEKSMPAHDESKALILIGRIGLSDKSLIITQEQHGMPVGFIWGNCEDDK